MLVVRQLGACEMVAEEVVGEMVEEVMEEEELLLWVVEVMAGMAVEVRVVMVEERACFEVAVLVWYWHVEVEVLFEVVEPSFYPLLVAMWFQESQ